ncbi:MAG: alternative ribosome rescue aminoacyl-tRNA hydrolase ArfB [bacterium]
MIWITPLIEINEQEIQFEFLRSPGPGGQNVNKVATSARLRFNIRASKSLPLDVRERLMHIAGKKVNSQGILIINARRFRTQRRNREDAILRLTSLIRKAAYKPVKRKKTNIPRSLKEQLLNIKRKKSRIKELRRHVNPYGE